jgi:serine/threonine protein kinase
MQGIIFMALKTEYSRVKLAFDERSKEHVAIKMVPRDFTELQVSLILNEVKALKYLGEGLFTPILDFNFTGEVEFPNGFRTRTVYYTMPLQENGEFY